MTKSPNKEKTEKKQDTQKSETQKDESRMTAYIIAGIVIILIVGMFALGITTTSQQEQTDPESQLETKTYGDFVFTKYDEGWVTELVISDQFKGWERTYTMAFHFTPDEVESIPTLKNALDESVAPNLFLDASKIYITMDPEYPAEVVLGAVEIAKIMGQIYEKDVEGATNRATDVGDAEIITCDDIGPGIRVIELRLGEPTSIYNEKGCIIVQGTTSTEVVRASTRLAYEMLKIL